MNQSADFSNWSCPVPLRDYPTVVMGHGAGGRLTGELIEHLFLPAFLEADLGHVLGDLGDAAVLDIGGHVNRSDDDGARLAFTTDSYVVRPRFFPGGNIGDLAVNGTVNDLAVVGATPIALSVGAILEEGLPLEELAGIAATMGSAARAAGVSIVTGDTKVVDAGHGDGLYLNTAGVGVVPGGVRLGPGYVRPGDAVLVSGPIAMHGMAVLSVRDGLEFGSEIVSDTAPLNGLTDALLRSGARVIMMRDATRGGVAAVLNEIAASSKTGVELVEQAIPIADEVRAACAFLGLDPLYVANEGRLVAFVRADDTEVALAAMQSTHVGAGATRIGTVTANHPGVVVARTGIGGSRVVDYPLGEQLPRIC